MNRHLLRCLNPSKMTKTSSSNLTLEFPDKSPTIGQIDASGSRLYSRWTSVKSGALLVVVNRTWTPGDFVVLHVLDVQRERVSEVRSDDWLRWIGAGNVKRVIN